MSCCGQKRSAIKQARPVAPSASVRAPSSPRSPTRVAGPGQIDQPRPSAAMLAYLARNACWRGR